MRFDGGQLQLPYDGLLCLWEYRVGDFFRIVPGEPGQPGDGRSERPEDSGLFLAFGTLKRI